MRKFERGSEPKFLTEARKKGYSWEKFSQTNRHKELRDLLYETQGRQCAYCESSIKKKKDKIDGHIEHLNRRKDAPNRTFDWSNLFFSCNRVSSCGNYKDNPKHKIIFNPDDIIDPSRENPADFFTYDPNGWIVPRGDISEAAKWRASETVRVFNLNSPELHRAREDAVKTLDEYRKNGYLDTEEGIDDFLTLCQDWPYLTVYYEKCGRKLA